MTTVTRRAALTAALAGAAACAPAAKRTAFTAVAPQQSIAFAHGVASGDPAADSVVLWTRVGASGPVDVTWEIAADEAFAQIAASGRVAARPESDYTVKVLAESLEPGTRYYYRFRAGDAVSAIGRTRTLPQGALSSARFAVVSCSNYPFGYFNVYDQIARRDDFDAVIHLGDYIYEYGREGYGGARGEALGRAHEPAHEIVTLADYRRRHAQYKSDPSSQAMHAAHALISIWDDHESANNSWKDGAENHQPDAEGDWNARRRAALQAYYEWMPVREPDGGAPREALFRRYSYGDLLTLISLETRLMARAKQFEYNEIVPTLTDAAAIARFRDETLWDAGRDMLGAAQLGFVDRALKDSVAAGQPWRIVANQIIMADVVAPDLTPHVSEDDLVALEKEWAQARAFVKFSSLGLPLNLDAWDGYPAAREKFYDAVKSAGGEGLIVLTGDTHTWWANDLKTKDGAPIGVELGVNSVTSPSPYRREFLGGKGAEYALLTTRENASVRYLSGEGHGFLDLEVTRERAQAQFIAVDTIDSPDYAAYVRASFSVRKKKGAPAFDGVSKVSFKQRVLFGRR